MAVDWSQFRPIEKKEDKPKQVDWSQFSPVEEPAKPDKWDQFVPVNDLPAMTPPTVKVVQNLDTSGNVRNPVAAKLNVKPDVPHSMTKAEQEAERQQRVGHMKQIAKEVVRSPLVGTARAVVEMGQNLFTAAEPGSPSEEGEGITMFEDIRDLAMIALNEAEAKLSGTQQTLPGQISATLFRFGVPYAAVTRGMETSTIASRLLKPVLAGTAVDLAVFDPYEQRLSTLMTEIGGPFDNAMTQWLSANEDDSFAEAKIKQALEGTAIGMTFEGVMALARTVKAARLARIMKEKGPISADVPSEITKISKGIKGELGVKGSDAEALLTMQKHFQDVNAAHDSALAAKDAMVGAQGNRISRVFSAENWIDASANVKKELLKRGGVAGKSAVMMHDLAAGSTPRAQMIFQEQAKGIYGGLNKDEITWLDKMINSRRIVQVDEYKGVGKVRHIKGLTGNEHQDFLNQLKLELGPEQFAKVQARADKYFDATFQQLRALRDNGVIGEDLFKKLENFDYSPIQFLEEIDPVHIMEIGGRKISVQDSGIKMIGKGSGAAVEMNSQELLAQVIGRTQGRIARNNANLALLKMAREVPDNGIVKVPKKVKHTASGRAKGVKTPKGMLRMSVMENGKQVPIFMDADLAGQWVTANPQVSKLAANLMRWGSGSVLIRPLATGMNPEFAITNVPRDLLHIYLTTDQYSPHLPIFAGQASRDLISTFKDAWGRKGAFKDYINEGGGMSFLTHQGQDMFASGSDDLLRQMDPHFHKLKEVLGYVGESSEIWTRLSLRARALRNGATPEEATWIARNYMDFSQGGKMAKTADHLVPYLNASIQAVRGAFRSAKTHPGQFATKIGWLQATAGMMYMANYMQNPEAMAEIPDHIKQDYWVFTTGQTFVDARGNTRHVYYKVKKDDTMKPLLFPIDAMFIKYFEDRDIDRSAIGTVATSLPLLQSKLPIPMMDAISTYATNYDMWFGDKVWRRGDTLPFPLSAEEYLGPGQSVNPTPKAWVDFGAATGLSPERARRAAGKLAPQNIFTDAVGGGWKLMTEGLSPEEQNKVTEELIAQSPMMRKFMSTTHPAETEFNKIDKVADPARAEQIRMNRDLDGIYSQFQQGALGEKSIEAWINSRPLEVRKQLSDRFMRRKQLDDAMAPFKGIEGLPSQIWWTNLASQPTDVRAELFYQEYVARDARKRQQMMRIAERFPGFYTKDMARDFGKVIRERGREEH